MSLPQSSLKNVCRTGGGGCTRVCLLSCVRHRQCTTLTTVSCMIDDRRKNEEQYFSLIKPERFARLLLHVYLWTNMLTLNSLRSDLLHITNLETDKPRGSSTQGLLNLAARRLYRSELRSLPYKPFRSDVLSQSTENKNNTYGSVNHQRATNDSLCSVKCGRLTVFYQFHTKKLASLPLVLPGAMPEMLGRYTSL